MSTLEPGLYNATVRGVPDQIVMVTDATYDYGVTQTPCPVVRGEHQHARIDITDARPLIVLDLDHMNIPAIIAGLRGSAFYTIADQIEAQTKPARTPEPGWGEKVTASLNRSVNRQVWLRVTRDSVWRNFSGDSAHWDDLIDPQPVTS